MKIIARSNGTPLSKHTQPVIYQYQLDKDINAERSDYFEQIDGGIRFIMSRPSSLITRTWYDIADDTAFSDISLTRFDYTKHNNQVKEQFYAQYKNFVGIVSEHCLQRDDIVMISKPDFSTEALCDIFVHFRTPSYCSTWKQFILKDYPNTPPVVPEDAVMAAVQFQQNNCSFLLNTGTGVQKYTSGSRVSLALGRNLCLADSKNIYTGEIGLHNNRVVIFSQLKEGCTAYDNRMALDENTILLGKDKGYIEFKPISLPQTNSSFHLVSITKGGVKLEIFDDNSGRWEQLDTHESTQSLKGGRILRLRANMEFGSAIYDLYVE